jgi:integrase
MSSPDIYAARRTEFARPVMLRWLVLTGSSRENDSEKPGDNGGLPARVTHGRVLTHRPFFDPDEVADAETEEWLADGIPDTTKQTYRDAWKWVIDWCADPKWGAGHPRQHIPMTTPTVCKMIKDSYKATKTLPDGSEVLAGRHGRPYAPSTVELRVAVISIVHQWQGLPSPTRHPSVALALRTYRRKWAKRGWRPDIAYAITPEDNAAMVRTCNLATVQGIRNAAMLRLQYELGARASEVCNLTFADLDWKSDTALDVHIVMSKGDKDRHSLVESDTDFAPDVDALLLVRQWIELAGLRGVTSGRLFRQVNPGKARKDGQISGSVRQEPIDRHAYEMVFIRAAERAGVHEDPTSRKRRHISTHGARSGFITAAVEAGMEIAQIAPHTGHALESPVIHRYYRSGRRSGDFNPGTRIRTVKRREREERAQGDQA